MKKIITTALILAMASTLSGCGSKEDSKSSTKSPEEAFFEELIDEYEDDEKKNKINLTDYVTATFNGWNGEYSSDVELFMDYEKLAEDISIEGITPEFLSIYYSPKARSDYFRFNGDEFKYVVVQRANNEQLSKYVDEVKKITELEIKTQKEAIIIVEGLKDIKYLTKVDKYTDMSNINDVLDNELQDFVDSRSLVIGTTNPLGKSERIYLQTLLNINGNIFTCDLQKTGYEKIGSYFAQKSTTDTQYSDDKKFTPNLYINVYKLNLINAIDNSKFECYVSVALGHILNDSDKGTVAETNTEYYWNSALDLNEVINFGEIYKAIEVK